MGRFCNLSELQLDHTKSPKDEPKIPRMARTTRQTRLISRVHAEVMILLSLSGSMPLWVLRGRM